MMALYDILLVSKDSCPLKALNTARPLFVEKGLEPRHDRFKHIL